MSSGYRFSQVGANSEAAMLDELESSSSRVYTHTRSLKGEVDYQSSLVSEVGNGLDRSTNRLQEEANYIARISKQADEGVSWMYGVIAVESFLLLFLLFNGI